MIPSEKDFRIFYQNPTWELGMKEYVSLLGGFFTHETNYNPSLIHWEKKILEATWRLVKSGIAILDFPENEENIFYKLSLASSETSASIWGCCFLDPTDLAVHLQRKYNLREDEAFNPKFHKELCHIFEKNGVGFDVPCPYISNGEV